MGIGLSFLCIFLSKQYLFQFHFSAKRIPYRKIGKYLFTLLIQIVSSAVFSAKTILTFQAHVQIVKIHTKLQDDFSIFVLANSITLTPGTITLLRKGQELFVLCLYKLPDNPEEAQKTIIGQFESILLEETV